MLWCIRTASPVRLQPHIFPKRSWLWATLFTNCSTICSTSCAEAAQAPTVFLTANKRGLRSILDPHAHWCVNLLCASLINFKMHIFTFFRRHTLRPSACAGTWIHILQQLLPSRSPGTRLGTTDLQDPTVTASRVCGNVLWHQIQLLCWALFQWFYHFYKNRLAKIKPSLPLKYVLLPF